MKLDRNNNGMNRCLDCCWWFDDESGSDRRVCVLHTGMKTAAVRTVDFGGNKPMRTVAGFGCTEWDDKIEEAHEA